MPFTDAAAAVDHSFSPTGCFSGWRKAEQSRGWHADANSISRLSFKLVVQLWIFFSLCCCYFFSFPFLCWALITFGTTYSLLAMERHQILNAKTHIVTDSQLPENWMNSAAQLLWDQQERQNLFFSWILFIANAKKSINYMNSMLRYRRKKDSLCSEIIGNIYGTIKQNFQNWKSLHSNKDIQRRSHEINEEALWWNISCLAIYLPIRIRSERRTVIFFSGSIRQK